MCGICGKFSFQSHEKVSEDLLDRMCRQIRHRGPDDQGMYVKDRIGLGMRRLSIIDVGGGHQPIHNEDKTVWVVCNGEIYNFQEIRDDLERRGHFFLTNSDTEVIVHAYEAYGVDCLAKFRGMFAFALWDEPRQRLVLARDRVGKKPLYYTAAGGALLFGSEIKSLLQDPSVARRVDLRALDLYLTHLYVPSPLTMFQGIYKLPPASLLICEKGLVKVERYWELDDTCDESVGVDEGCERLRSLLRESVRLRMISDVPLGAFLSGGLDSSIVVALMAEQSRFPVKTFSIGFEEEEFSELKYARIVAERFGTDHHELIVKPDITDLIPKMVWHFNEPFGDSSAVPTFYLSEMTRRSVTVALSGDGGDELFAGYTKYIALKRKDDLPYVLKLLNRMINRSTTRVKLTKLWPESLPNRAIRSLRVRTMSFEQRNEYWGTTFDDSYKSFVYNDNMKEGVKNIGHEHHYLLRRMDSRATDPLSRVLFADLTGYLPDDLLVKVDISSMANSLEVRCPFLDHIFVEFAMTIPGNLKLFRGATKYILKEAFSKVLPVEILQREKAGFAIPLDKWLREDLREWSYELLLDPDMREFFNGESLKYILDSHSSGRSNQGSKIWALLNFVLWYKLFIRASPTV